MKFIQSLDAQRKASAEKQVTYENVTFTNVNRMFTQFLNELARNNLISEDWSNNGGIWDDHRACDGVLLETTANPMIYNGTPQLIVQGSHQALLKFKSVMERYAEYNGAPKPEDIKVPHQYHDELNPELWDSEGDIYVLKEDVRDKLMEQAEAFFSYLKMEDMDIDDIVLTGSSANYNWTENSDVDLHIVVDKKQAEQKYGKIVEEYFSAKKRLWNDLHNIRVKNVPVEFYVEGSDERAISAGVYSIMNDEWVTEPTHDEPTVDDTAVKAKAGEMIKEIIEVLDADKASAVEKVVEKIGQMRQAGLDKNGEFSCENLAFKALRAGGWLERLYDCKNKVFDRELSTEDEEWSHFC
jgi:predicted nucleotidyltransferase